MRRVTGSVVLNERQDRGHGNPGHSIMLLVLSSRAVLGIGTTGLETQDRRTSTPDKDCGYTVAMRSAHFRPYENTATSSHV